MKKLQASRDQFFTHIANMIKEHKRMIIGVPHTKKEIGFYYTIGNQEKRLPELLLLGNFNGEDAALVLNALSEKMIDEKRVFENGEEVSLGGAKGVLVWDAKPTARDTHTVQAGQFYNDEDYTVQQIVVADPNGRWPNDPLCNKKWRVPLLNS